MRRLRQTIKVVADADGRPLQFTTRYDTYRVTQILETWREGSAWWAGEVPRWFFRVEAGGTFDLSHGDDGDWRLEVAWD
ncbi:MAG TPA: hypothetical protein DCZ72_09320 [Armatimonadetes bacterium]|nr:hypothetical protein [Armatimonadota bacterium]